jgi:hypothetical protein
MSYTRHIYYNFLAIKNNLILIFLLIANSIVPNYFNEQIIKYKLKGDEYFKYIVIFKISDEIKNKYNIDMISIGLQLYDKYKSIEETKETEKEDSLSTISDISDISEISDISDISN